MKKIVAAAALALALTATQSYGFTLNGYEGPIELKFAGVTSSLDPTYIQQGETWGVFSLSAVTDGFNNIWSASAGDYVYGIIYGLYDVNGYANTASQFGYTIEQAGGSFAVYSTPTMLNFGTLTTAGRTAYDQFTGITDGTLLFAGDFSPGVLPTSTYNPTIVQDVTALQSPANGKGAGYGDVDVSKGGSYAEILDSDLPSLNNHDLFFQFTVGYYTGANDWDQAINDPVTGAAVPEPGTIVLLGLGMFGLAIYGKRRMDQNAV